MIRCPLAAPLLLVTVACTNAAGTDTPPEARPDRPNILLLVADDMGFSDLGFMGSEIRTPRLDALAAEGTVLTRFYVSPTCSPTRAMLLSGVDAHVAGLGSMSGEGDARQYGQPGYEGFLTHRVVTVASLLRDAGYATSMVGKWHLGEWDVLLPHNRGFERSFVLPGPGASHFADAQRLGDAPVPAQYLEDGLPVSLPADFFSSDFYTDRLIEYLDAARKDGRPFFAYAAYTAPHWPLHAKDEDLELYRGRYDEGWDVLRERRMAGLVKSGGVSASQPVPERVPFAPEWESLSVAERRVHARKMEIYAAMVENLDRNIGRLLDHLRRSGTLEQTLVLFFSDNGAEGNPIEEAPWTARAVDNSLENMGRVGSYVSYGPGWAQASTVPFRLFKSFTTEGGVRTPFIASLPGASGGRTHHDVFATVKDVTPTLLDWAGVDHPGRTYRGRPVAEPEGRTMLPFLRGTTPTVHPPEASMGWELFGRRAIVQGDWKLVWLWGPYGIEQWELFNLAQDPGESRDLSQESPQRLQEMQALWADYARRNRVILPATDTSYALEIVE